MRMLVALFHLMMWGGLLALAGTVVALIRAVDPTVLGPWLMGGLLCSLVGVLGLAYFERINLISPEEKQRRTRLLKEFEQKSRKAS